MLSCMGSEFRSHSQQVLPPRGGWLDLPNQYALDFHGFEREITKSGFGKTDGRKWVGFSGGLRLVDALPAGVSVEGIRLTWDEDLLLSDPQKAIQVTLDGDISLDLGPRV